MRKESGFVLAVLFAVSHAAYATDPNYADQFATSGTGTTGDPYKGWESALAADTQVIFNKGFYESPVSAITVPSGSVLSGVEGAILRWPANRSSVNPLLSVPAGNSNIVIQGLHFEAGVTVPADGVSSQGGQAYISLGTDGSASTVSHVRIEHCRFGVARYPTQGGGGGYQVIVTSSVEDFMLQNNKFDAATHNVVFVPGHTTQQYYYRRFLFQNNLVDFSQTRYWFGGVISMAPDFVATVPALVDQISIVGNTIRQANGTFDVSLAGNGILVASNISTSDNMDGFIGVFAPTGSTATNVVISGNSCYATDSSGDSNKIQVPSCQLKINNGVNVTVIGNNLRGPSTVSRIDIVNSTHVIVDGNANDKAHSEPESGDVCFMVGRLANASYSNNTCMNTGGDMFYVWGDTGQVHDLSFTNNLLFTTAASEIASNFFNFAVTASDITIRENKLFGKNLASGGLFIKNSNLVTRLNRVGNQEAIQETGWRIGTDEVKDVTGSGLQLSSGALGVNAGTGLQISSGSLAIDSTVATLAGIQSLSNKTLTDTSNVFPQTTALVFSSPTAISTQSWFGPNTGNKGTSATSVSVPMPSTRVKSLWCKVGTAPGASKSWTFVVLTGTVVQEGAMSCEISGASATTCNTAGTFDVAAGAALSIRATPANTPASTTVFCSIGASPEEVAE